MNWLSNSRGRLETSLLLLFSVVATLLPTSVVHAQGGIAMAGPFYQQEFELPQGTEITNPSIYVVVFNHTAQKFTVEMIAEVPYGVEVLFDQSRFPLQAGGEKTVYITVRVANDAVPGEYEIVVAAKASPQEGGEVKIATSVAQKASLVVTGESAQISCQVVSPDGDPIKAEVRLSKVVQDGLNEFARSETGALQVKVSPGSYQVSAYIGGRKLAEETVEVESAENKEIILEVRTIYFEFFGIEPNYTPDTGQLAFVKVAYTVNNLYQPVNNGEVVLQVKQDGQPLEQTSLLSLSRLDLGRTEGNYSYVRTGGWVTGDYVLKLDLYIEEELYTDSSEEELQVALPSLALAPSGLNPWWIAGGIAVIVILAVIVVAVRRYRHKHN